MSIRDRPFNLQEGVMVFCFVQKMFFGQHKSQNIYFFCRAKREIFFQYLILGYMTKTLNQIIFFFLHQNQNIFFSNIGNQNIFLEKNHNLLLQVKWSFPKQILIVQKGGQGYGGKKNFWFLGKQRPTSTKKLNDVSLSSLNSNRLRYNNRIRLFSS